MFKKSERLLCQEPKPLRFQFIHRYHKEFGIKWLCQKLKVSRQGYYRFIKHQTSDRQKKFSSLRSTIIALFFKFNSKMGAAMLHNYMINEGYTLSLGFVKSVLKMHGLKSKIVKTYKKQIKPHQTFENKLNREFSATMDSQINKKIVCDITEWRLNNGKKVYLCAALDLATRAIVGYKVALTSKKELVLDVLKQLYESSPKTSLLFHSDQGSQFTSKQVVETIRQNGWSQSMSRKGNCWDNAVIESFFSSIKREELKWHTFHSLVQAERIVKDYIEGYYMIIRPHKSLGGVPPIQYVLKINQSTKTQK
ncbi:IS3 family transposase [Carnobacterium maltaromaticum]|uniref:IS3 family transposase n=1 Tax=Carnobacterium maltaromaticum TaxID=2751 RepID=UPI003B97EB87